MAVISQMPVHEKASRYLRKIEQEGAIYHPQMVNVAFMLRDDGCSYHQAVFIMHEASKTVTRREPRPGEIEGAVAYAFQCSPDKSSKFSKQSTRKVRRNQAVIDEWASKGSANRLMEMSDQIPDHPSEILEHLFDGDDLLHLSPDIFHDQIVSLSEWIDAGLDKMQYFCPCTFKNRQHGRLAKNVLFRKYIVFETDERPYDWDGQAGLIERLAQALPLVLVVASGNKSWHSFHLANGNESAIEKFNDLVITLGGDHSVTRPAQMVRFPFGTNSRTGNKQKVIYFSRGN
jgi:hypothetical protein